MILLMIIANVGWLLVMYLVVGCHLKIKRYTDSELQGLYNTMASYREAIIKNTVHDIRGGLNGITNKLDDVEKAIQGYIATSKESTNTLVDNVEKYFNFYNESVINSIVTITKNDNCSCKQIEKISTNENGADVDWTDFVADDNEVECCSHKYRHDTKKEIYHNQEVRIGNQTEERLRDLIDIMWQRAYSHKQTLSDSDYEELALIHRNISAMLIKAHRGLWKESNQEKLDLYN